MIQHREVVVRVGEASFLALVVAGCGASTGLSDTDATVIADGDAVAPADVGSAPLTTCDAGDPGDGDDYDDATSLPHVVELAVASQFHQCARMSDGTVRCQGGNEYGALGLGATDIRFVGSTPVPGLTDVVQVVTSDLPATCTLHRDGTVRCWGSNNYNSIGVGHDGDETCEGGERCRPQPTLVPGLTDATFLAANLFAFCAVRRDGSVWCWGDSGLPALAPGSPTPAPVSGLNDVVWMRPLLGISWIVRHRDGHYDVSNSFPADLSIPASADPPVGPQNSHFCYRLPDSSVRCEGIDAHGKIGNGTSMYPDGVTAPWDPGLCGVRSVVTGAYDTCALLADRTVSCWGDDTHDALGTTSHETCVGILGAARCATRPTPIPGLDRVAQLFMGVWVTCALRLDHSVWCWGEVPGLLVPPSTPTSVNW